LAASTADPRATATAAATTTAATSNATSWTCKLSLPQMSRSQLSPVPTANDKWADAINDYGSVPICLKKKKSVSL
jgi:hypothetical protein